MTAYPRQYIVVVSDDGKICWYNFGNQLHNENGPAIDYPNGDKEWLQNDKQHRVGGPAVEYADGHKEWWLYGLLHNEEGPAVMYAPGTRQPDEYWLDGIELSKEEWHAKLKVKNVSSEGIKKAEHCEQPWCKERAGFICECDCVDCAVIRNTKTSELTIKNEPRECYSLLDEKGDVVASGSYDAVMASARLFWGSNARLVNVFENKIMAYMDEAVKKDIDDEMLSNLHNPLDAPTKYPFCGECGKATAVVLSDNPCKVCGKTNAQLTAKEIEVLAGREKPHCLRSYCLNGKEECGCHCSDCVADKLVMASITDTSPGYKPNCGGNHGADVHCVFCKEAPGALIKCYGCPTMVDEHTSFCGKCLVKMHEEYEARTKTKVFPFNQIPRKLYEKPIACYGCSKLCAANELTYHSWAVGCCAECVDGFGSNWREILFCSQYKVSDAQTSIPKGSNFIKFGEEKVKEEPSIMRTCYRCQASSSNPQAVMAGWLCELCYNFSGGKPIPTGAYG